MKRADLEALGLTKEQVDAVRSMYYKELDQYRGNGARNNIFDALIAVATLLPASDLRALLLHASNLYNNRNHPQTPEDTNE